MNDLQNTILMSNHGFNTGIVTIHFKMCKDRFHSVLTAMP
jgi:hypothetical protein